LPANKTTSDWKVLATFLHFLCGQGRELRQKSEAPFANCLAHLTIAHIGEKYERRGGAEFPGLEKAVASRDRARATQSSRDNGRVSFEIAGVRPPPYSKLDRGSQ